MGVRIEEGACLVGRCCENADSVRWVDGGGCSMPASGRMAMLSQSWTRTGREPSQSRLCASQSMWPITGVSVAVTRRARIRRARSSTQAGPGCWFMSRSRSSGQGHRPTPDGPSRPTAARAPAPGTLRRPVLPQRGRRAASPSVAAGPVGGHARERRPRRYPRGSRTGQGPAITAGQGKPLRLRVRRGGPMTHW